MTSTIPAKLYVQSGGDPDILARLVAEWVALGEAQSEIDGTYRKVAAKRARKAKAPPEPAPKGPWVLSIEGMGRPPTTNAERTSVRSRGAMERTREIKRTWDSAVCEAARAEGVPHLDRALTIVQPYYSNNTVTDPDGTAPAHKAIHDGLVMAGVLDDDDRSRLVMGYQVLPPITDGNPERMTVTVFPLPA